MSNRPKILTVDDKPQNLYALERILQKLDVDIMAVTSGNEALGLAIEHDFCVAIVDVQMPGMDGYELVELLRGNDSTATLPVIFVSAIFSDEYHHHKGYDAGAVDFLSKPFLPEILLSKVRVFIDLYRQRRELQTMVEELNRANAVLARRSLQLETSSKVGQQVTGILNLDSLLTQVVHAVESGFGYSQVGIWLVNENRQALILQTGDHPASLSLASDREARLPASDEIVRQVFLTSNIALMNDLFSDPLSARPAQGLWMIGSELALPLVVQGETLGVLDIQSERPNAFLPDDITALRIITDQVAIAIRNASLYMQLKNFNVQLEDTVLQRTEELQRAYNTLEQLDKTKSDFITVAGHELRTPLTLIRGYASMLEEMVSSVPGAPEMVQGIITGEGRLFEVVNSMLDASHIDNATLKLHKEWFDPGLALTSLKLDFAEIFAQRNITCILENMDILPKINADPDLFRKLFHHLISNAVKFTPDGGKVFISGSQLPPGQLTDLSLSALRIMVSDTGIGIDPSYHELIFEKFYQTGPVQFHSSSKTKFKGGGPGLGLAIARGIVNAHGGRIWVESAGYDEANLPGSAFHVLLPLASSTNP